LKYNSDTKKIVKSQTHLVHLEWLGRSGLIKLRGLVRDDVSLLGGLLDSLLVLLLNRGSSSSILLASDLVDERGESRRQSSGSFGARPGGGLDVSSRSASRI
jgi:hypothetical protein